MWKLLFCLYVALAVNATPLDDYVWQEDKHYSYQLISDWTHKTADKTSYLINMTSQRWLTDADTDRSVWWHYLVIHIPNEFDPEIGNSGYVLIDGGSNNAQETPDKTDHSVVMTGLISDATKTVTADLKQIPNEHLRFYADPENKSRTEDGIIAFTWRHFINDPTKPEWLLRLPMTKAVVKAMDTITDFVNKTTGKEITNYCVGGLSKRGWTTWTTGAVDNKRVKCVTPIVMDELNMVKNLHHHFRAYGGWSFAFGDYYLENITQDLDHPNMIPLAAIVDPFSYLDRLTMPKMVFSAGGDEFFLPDDSHYYFSALKGPKYVNMLPNSEHSCDGHETQLRLNIQAFYVSVLKGLKLPQLSWSLYSTSSGGGIEVSMDTQPVIIRAWSVLSVSNTRRDFRLLRGNITDPASEPIEQANLWFSYGVTKTENMKYKAEFETPENGHWRAFYIQMTFPGPDGTVFEATTETNIIPNKFPFPDCYKESCRGTLV